jgi:hypothetical protein
MKLAKNFHLSLLVSLIGILCLPVQTVANDKEQKWEAFLDLEGKAGTKRDLGEADLFIPLIQDQNTLFFTDVRYRLDNQSSKEGNFGLGIRHILPSDWIIGGYGYYDRKKSFYDNMFKQITLGVEALLVDWDFRANAYIPIGKKSYLEESLSSVKFANSSILYYQGEERSLKGYDAEIGWRLPIFNENDGQQIRLYAGGYKFYNGGVETVKGPRGRFELTFNEVPFLWEGSRLTLEAETQRDDVRGRQSFASFRLRIPFSTSKIKKKAKLNAIEKRMTTPIVRDVDIVSQAGVFEEPMEVSATSNGENIVLISANNVSSGAELNTLIQSAGDNATVVLNGEFKNIDALLNLKSGQTIIGSGNLPVNLPNGNQVSISLPGASISGEGAVYQGQTLFTTEDNTKLIGLNINLASTTVQDVYAVDIRGDDNVVISNNTITISSTNDKQMAIFTVEGLPGNPNSISITNNHLNVNAYNNTIQTASIFKSLSPFGSSHIEYSNNTSSVLGAANPYFIRKTQGAVYFSGSNNSSNVTSFTNTDWLSGPLYFTNGDVIP